MDFVYNGWLISLLSARVGILEITFKKRIRQNQKEDNKGRITNDKTTVVVVFSLPLPASIDIFCLLMGEFNHVERVDGDPPYLLR
jgi:hypothetical protein